LTIFTLEGAHPAYDQRGFPSCLAVSGTLVYGQVVIVANSKLAFSTHAHTIWSTLMFFLSILSFFLIYYIENLWSWIPQLWGTFNYALIIPSFHFTGLFFFLFVIGFEALF
jgi:hypothetical protein